MLKHFCKRIYDLLTVFTVSEKNSWELFWHPCQLSYSFRSKIWIYPQLSSVQCPPLHSMQASENMFHSTRSGAGHIRPLSMISKIEERLVKAKHIFPPQKIWKKDWCELVESSEKMASVLYSYNSWNHFRLLLLRTILFIRIGSEENLPIQEYTVEKVTVNVHFQKLMRQKNLNRGKIFIQKKMSWIFMISQLDDNMMDSTVHPPPRHIIQHDQEGKNFL